MNLGLSELSDDQLIALLQEVLQECGERDPVLRKITQTKINEGAGILDSKRKMAQRAIGKLRKRYIGELQQEFESFISKQLTAGTLRLVTPEEESEIIRQAIAEAKENCVEGIKSRHARLVKEEVLSGKMDIYTPEEQQKMIQEATASAIEWLKRRGTIPLEKFAEARAAVFKNLVDMGHKSEDVLLLYGRPDLPKPFDWIKIPVGPFNKP